MGQLSNALNEVVDQLRPSQVEQERQKAAFEQVRSTLLHQWPQAKVHLFGSTANCLSICNNNDIDVCLELPEGIEDQVGNALNLAGMLRCAWSRHSLAAEYLLHPLMLHLYACSAINTTALVPASLSVMSSIMVHLSYVALPFCN